MELNERQYELIARYLDGEPVELRADEQAAAEELRCAGLAIGPMLGVRPPRVVMDRVRRRMLADLARQSHRTTRLGWRAAAVAVAAVLLAAASTWLVRPQTGPQPSAERISTALLAERLPGEDTDIDLDLIGTELSELEADLVVSLLARASDVEFDILQEKLDTFWFDDSGVWPREM
jgi:hypothetical protein